jgi:hypothetical protein
MNVANLLTLQSPSAWNVVGGTQNVGPITFVGALTLAYAQAVAITSSGITVAVPSGTFCGVVIVPPTTNAYTLLFKTVSGDTGVNIPQSTPSIQLFDQANLPANIYLKSGTTVIGLTSLLWF